MNEKNMTPPISDEKRKGQQSDNQKPIQLGSNREGSFQQKGQQRDSYNAGGSNTDTRSSKGPVAAADEDDDVGNLDTAEGNRMRKSGT